MMSGINYRNDCGATFDIQTAFLRASEDPHQPNSVPEYQVLPLNQHTWEQPKKDCGCKEGETCNLCDNDLKDICTTEEVKTYMTETSPFLRTARLISTVKVYDYISLVEHAYAKTGNKPFKLKSNKEITIRPEQVKELASIMEAQIGSFIEQNDVRIDEIPRAFDFGAIGDMVRNFEEYMRKKAMKMNEDDLKRYEDSIERTFNRTNFMGEYIECLKDTANFPFGVLWVDDNAVKKEKVISGGKVKLERKIQATAERVHPSQVWFTPDYTFSSPGRAVFRVKRFTHGDILSWKELDVAGSSFLNRNIDKFLEDYNEGCFIPYIMLFRNLDPIVNYDYDVMIARGMFSKEHVKELGVEIPDHVKGENFIPCEIYFSGSYILRCRVMNAVDKYFGVYTTVFRRNCDSIYGYSVYDFCLPFAKLYATTLDAIDVAVGKSMGMILQLDRAVIQDAEKYFKRDRSGEIIFRLDEDQFIEFNSAQAYGSPNFKGIPLTVTEIPNNLDKLLPMLELVLSEMERITKIPNLLTDGSDISSALRTTSNMNMAYNSSAKVIQALLREGESRVLYPAIQYLFDCEIINERIPKGLLELEPEILLSDTLIRDTNDSEQLIAGLQVLSQYAQIIPPDKFATLLNTVARTSFGFREDIVPDAGIFNIERRPQEQSVV